MSVTAEQRRLTCTVAIATNPAQLAASRAQRAYAFRADGRTGSVRRGSTVLQADLIALYVADPAGDGSRRPARLDFENLFIRGLVTRGEGSDTTYEPHPAVRLNARWLARCTGQQIRYDVWPEERSLADTRPALVAAKAAGAVARTEGSQYMMVPILPFSAVVGDQEAPATWRAWADELARHWENETREDDFGEPFVRVLGRELSADLIGLAPILTGSLESLPTQQLLDHRFRPGAPAPPKRPLADAPPP